MHTLEPCSSQNVNFPTLPHNGPYWNCHERDARRVPTSSLQANCQYFPHTWVYLYMFMSMYLCACMRVCVDCCIYICVCLFVLPFSFPFLPCLSIRGQSSTPGQSARGSPIASGHFILLHKSSLVEIPMANHDKSGWLSIGMCMCVSEWVI